jgi:hypothetical protein
MKEVLLQKDLKISVPIVIEDNTNVYQKFSSLLKTGFLYAINDQNIVREVKLDIKNQNINIITTRLSYGEDPTWQTFYAEHNYNGLFDELKIVYIDNKDILNTILN